MQRPEQAQTLRIVANNDKLAGSRITSAWTRPEDYLGTLARRRTARREREAAPPRTQPEAPRFALSTLPFLALIAGLAVLTLAIFIAAWPGGSREPPARAEASEIGTAPKGWFQEAEREFRS